MLEIDQLQAAYGPLRVLHGVSLCIRQGQIAALLGSNGAGKSTLNNHISGIYAPVGGRIRLDGEDVTGAAPQEMVARGVVQVPEGRRIFPTLSVRENLEMGAYRRGRKHLQRNVARVFALFPRLEERTRQLSGTLSGGEQQMLAIGRGLMAEPRLLILDEPSLGLAPLLVEEMFLLIRRLHQDGLTVFLVEQNVVQSLEIATYAYVLENGRIAMQGRASELMAGEALRKSYLGL